MKRVRFVEKLIEIHRLRTASRSLPLSAQTTAARAIAAASFDLVLISFRHPVIVRFVALMAPPLD
jgi:hypothetical protein